LAKSDKMAESAVKATTANKAMTTASRARREELKRTEFLDMGDRGKNWSEATNTSHYGHRRRKVRWKIPVNTPPTRQLV